MGCINLSQEGIVTVDPVKGESSLLKIKNKAVEQKLIELYKEYERDENISISDKFSDPDIGE